MDETLGGPHALGEQMSSRGAVVSRAARQKTIVWLP